jgi:hypothetical protein
MDQHYQQWSELGPRGLLLIGAGISLVGEAVVQRARRRSALRWLLLGTLGLVALNAGVSLFGESVKHRALYESRLEL